MNRPEETPTDVIADAALELDQPAPNQIHVHFREWLPTLNKNTEAFARFLEAYPLPCRVSDISIDYRGAAIVYALIFDLERAPLPGAVPHGFIELNPALSGANTANGYKEWTRGRVFKKGCMVVLSSTVASYTELAVGEAIIDVNFDKL